MLNTTNQPIVSASLHRLRSGISLKSIGYAIGVWAFSNFEELEVSRQLELAVRELRDASGMSDHDSGYVWARGRAFTLALWCVRESKLGSTEGFLVGHLRDCHNELFEEIVDKVEYVSPGLALAIREADVTWHRDRAESSWGVCSDSNGR